MYCCLYFGSNTVCSEVLHLSFIQFYSTLYISTLLCLPFDLFFIHSSIAIFNLWYQVPQPVEEYTHCGVRFLAYVSLICFQFVICLVFPQLLGLSLQPSCIVYHTFIEPFWICVYSYFRQLKICRYSVSYFINSLISLCYLCL